MIRVGILGFSRREGTFSEVGLRSWEEAGCAAVEAALMHGAAQVYVVHRPLVLRISRGGIQRTLRDWCDAPHAPSRCHVILTVGGTGHSPADIVPEATLGLIKQDLREIADLLRRTVADAGYPVDGVSRGIAGLRGGTLLINLPGSIHGFAVPEPLTAATQALLPVLPTLVSEIQSAGRAGDKR